MVDAVEIGYRLIDTAAKYGNETGVGKGIRDVTGPVASTGPTCSSPPSWTVRTRVTAGRSAGSMPRCGDSDWTTSTCC